MIRGIIKFVLKITTLLLYRVKRVGMENIEEGKPYIICPNHISNWDPPTIVASIKRNDLYVLAKEELFANRFLIWLAKKVHALPVKRGKQDIAILKNSLKILKQDHIILLFPEGTRNGIKKKGKLQNGAALMALKSGVPVIPVGIQGNYKAFTKVKINYGKPMYFEEYKNKEITKSVLDEVSDQIMQEIVRLTNENI